MPDRECCRPYAVNGRIREAQYFGASSAKPQQSPADAPSTGQTWPQGYRSASQLEVAMTASIGASGAALSRIPTPLEARPQKIRYGSLSGPTSEDHKGAVRNRCITPHEVAVPGNRIGVGNEHTTGARGRSWL